MSNDQPGRRPPAKSGGGGAPMGSTISIVIAVVAVVIGFFILRNINDDSGGATDIDIPDSDETSLTLPVDPSSTTTATTLPQSSTTAPFDVSAKVVVANASGISGSAGTMTTALAGVGFNMGTATNATGVEARLPISKVYYLPGGEATAASVAVAMGGIQATAMPAVVPIEGDAASLADALVLVMLGEDLGGKPLPILSPDSGTTLPATPLDTTTSTTTA